MSLRVFRISSDNRTVKMRGVIKTSTVLFRTKFFITKTYLRQDCLNNCFSHNPKVSIHFYETPILSNRFLFPNFVYYVSINIWKRFIHLYIQRRSVNYKTFLDIQLFPTSVLGTMPSL